MIAKLAYWSLIGTAWKEGSGIASLPDVSAWPTTTRKPK